MMKKNGVYLITNDEPFDILFEKISIFYNVNSTSCPIELLQYRRKQLTLASQKKELQLLKPFCEKNGITLIINDNMHLAYEFELGLHLGQDDGDISEARKLLGNNKLIGSTCHQSLDLALHAQNKGADYAAFGVFKSSKTKPNAKRVSTALLSQAIQSLQIPICVIGGVEISDFEKLNTLGVRYFAVINSLLAGDIKQVRKNAIQLQAWQQNQKALNFEC